MPSISRRLPQSNIGRLEALTRLKIKKDSLPSSANILTPDTTGRLDTIQPQFYSAMNEVAFAHAIYSAQVEDKMKKRRILSLLCSHFIQVFNFMVDRGDAKASERAFFKLKIERAVLPDMSTEEKLLQVAKDLIDGEDKRVEAGGIPMVNPDIDAIKNAYQEFRTSYLSASAKLDDLDKKRNVVGSLVTEADGVIRRAWAEVEARYAEEEPESRRENAREWGVVYINIGEKKTIITVLVTNKEDGSPNTSAIGRLVNADIEVEADSQGLLTFETDEIGDDSIIIESPGRIAATLSVNINEGINQQLSIQLASLPLN